MKALPETPQETEERKQFQLKEQRSMLEHLSHWLRKTNLKQKDIASELGVSEGTVSKWLRGQQAMSVGQLRQIAVLMKANPADLLRSPEDAQLSPAVESTLKVMDALTEEEWNRVLEMARMIAGPRLRDDK